MTEPQGNDEMVPRRAWISRGVTPVDGAGSGTASSCSEGQGCRIRRATICSQAIEAMTRWLRDNDILVVTRQVYQV